MISHINACNQTAANPKCGYTNLLSIATIAFDTSLEDILTGFTNGIEIIFADDVQIKNIVELIKLIKEHEPEVMEFTPSRLLSYLEVDEFNSSQPKHSTLLRNTVTLLSITVMGQQRQQSHPTTRKLQMPTK